MKAILFKTITAVCLTVCISGCSGSAGSENGVVGDRQSNKNVQNSDIEKPRSSFPPLPEKIAQGELINLDKTTFTIADRKGKVVLLNLWATWCGPCRSEMPTLIRLQENLGADGLEVIGLNSDDESIDLINNFAAEMKLNYTLVWSSRQMQIELLNVSKFAGIPQSFLIDRDGGLRGVFRGANPADIRQMERLVTKVVAE